MAALASALMRLRSTFLILSCLLLCSLAFAPAAGAGKKMEVALQDEAVFVHRYFYSIDAAYAQARRLEVTWLRSNVIWSKVLPGREVRAKRRPRHLHYNWAIYDRLIREARAHGVKVELTLTGGTIGGHQGAPAFATSNHRVGVHEPSPAEFGRFVDAAVRHFRTKGITRYTIWNEPNFGGWLQPIRTAPDQYRRLYLAAYSVIRKLQPKAQILIGETSPYGIRGQFTSPIEFLRRTSCVTSAYRRIRSRACSGTLRADGYAQHPYDYQHPPTHRYPDPTTVTIGSLDRLTTALDRLARVGAMKTIRGGKMPLYLTEFGYFHQPGDHRNLSEVTRARYLPQAFDIAARNPRVRQMLYYGLAYPPDYLNSAFTTYLVKLSGDPFPIFNSFEKWAQNAAKAGRIARAR